MRYEFRIKGTLSEEISHEFTDFDVSDVSPETVLFGEVTDSAHLHGVLSRLQQFGLQIVSLHAAPDETGSRNAAGS